MEKIMAVVTREKRFAERLCDYVNKKNDLVLTAVPFDNMRSCASFSESHPLELLLADRDMIDEDGFSKLPGGSRVPRTGRTILLDEGVDTGNDVEEKREGISATIRKYDPLHYG